MLFVAKHVPGMSILNIYFNLTNESDLPEIPPMSATTRSNVLFELMQVSKPLQEVIMVSTACNNIVDELMKMMVPKGHGVSTSQVAEPENARTIKDQDGNDNEDVSSASEVGSGYGSCDNFEDLKFI